MTDIWRLVGLTKIDGDSLIIRTRDADNAFVNPPGAVAHVAIKGWDWPGVDLRLGTKPELGVGTCEYPINPNHRIGAHTVQIVQPGTDSAVVECDVHEAGKGWRVVFRLELGQAPPTAPTIESFFVTPSAIAPGASALLTWSITNADTAQITPGIGSVSSTGSLPVSPGETITYQLTATGPGGTTTATAQVVVQGTQPPPDWAAGIIHAIHVLESAANRHAESANLAIVWANELRKILANAGQEAPDCHILPITPLYMRQFSPREVTLTLGLGSNET